MKRVIFILIAMIASITAMAQETANERLIAATEMFNVTKEQVIEISKIDKRYERCYVVQEELRDFYFESLKDTPNYPEKTLDEIMALWNLSLRYYTKSFNSFPLVYQYKLLVVTFNLLAEQKTLDKK